MSTLDSKGVQFYTQVSDASVISFSSGFQQHLLDSTWWLRMRMIWVYRYTILFQSFMLETENTYICSCQILLTKTARIPLSVQDCSPRVTVTLDPFQFHVLYIRTCCFHTNCVPLLHKPIQKNIELTYQTPTWNIILLKKNCGNWSKLGWFEFCWIDMKKNRLVGWLTCRWLEEIFHFHILMPPRDCPYRFDFLVTDPERWKLSNFQGP